VPRPLRISRPALLRRNRPFRPRCSPPDETPTPPGVSRPTPWRSASWGRGSAGWRERKSGPRKVFASQGPEYGQEQSCFLRRKTRRAAFQAEFQGALAWTTAGATLAPLRASARFASPGTKRDREGYPVDPWAACLVAASDSWPLNGVRLSASSRLGSLSDPLEKYRRMHQSFFGSLCGPYHMAALRTAKRRSDPPCQHP
jgi:hypothetical protein